ncbi:MAG: class I SAM-dependent methyltransferase [Kangiellaceae bacterium]|jgi:2-polyprenyl-3-methyl-5-hydroxy-6-metoxy-1,4-benzoquinol methylase|nr:class I SAM-dependent methyltransferase [Kangiellaceae bacterium]
MISKQDYLKANKALWNQRVAAHLNSDFYDNESFMQGRNSLNKIELDLLGDVSDQSIIHLQCHFGQDTLSLARMGAKVTGVDLSDKAIATARDLNTQLGLDATFIEYDVLSFDQVHNQTYDTVFASYGVIGWHPDIVQWASVVSHLLKPGGRLVFAEFHPVIWMLDEEFQTIKYNYYNDGAIIDTVTNSYVDGSELDHPMNEYGWNHSLGEVFNALQAAGLQVTNFNEYNYSPYNCFSRCVPCDDGYYIEGYEGKVPLVYSLVARKN